MDASKGVLAGILATLIFGFIFLGYSYMKASALLDTYMPGSNTVGFSMFYAYNWMGWASFAPAPVSKAAMALGNTDISPYVLSSFQNQYYYALAIISGLIGGMVVFDRKKMNFPEAAIAAIVPAAMIVLFIVIAGMVLARIAAPGMDVGYGASAYLPIALVNYLLFAVGSLGAALIKLR